MKGLLGLVFGLVGSLAALAEEAAPVAASIRVEVQMVSVSPETAMSLTPALRDEQKVEAAWARLQEMILRDEAMLLGWPIVWLRSGHTVTAETIEECRYPEEFVPRSAPVNFGGPHGGVSSGRSLPRSYWGAEVPTSFETRNIGAVLEANTALDSTGQFISLNVRSEFSRLLGFQHQAKQRSNLGIEGLFHLPRFSLTKVSTSIMVRSGRPALLGVFVVDKPTPHVELYIVRAKATLLTSVPSPPTAP